MTQIYNVGTNQTNNSITFLETYLKKIIRNILFSCLTITRAIYIIVKPLYDHHFILDLRLKTYFSSGLTELLTQLTSHQIQTQMLTQALWKKATKISVLPYK